MDAMVGQVASRAMIQGFNFPLMEANVIYDVQGINSIKDLEVEGLPPKLMKWHG